MHKPAEAIEELRFIVDELNLRVAFIPPCVARPISGHEASFPIACRTDYYGIDSDFDYDDVWREFGRLRVPVLSHAGVGLRYLPVGRFSPTNYCFNHIGGHAYAQSLLCEAMVFGGVPKRHPELPFGFLECGMGWVPDVLHALEEHWEKRRRDALDMRLDPERLDLAEFRKLIAQYGAEAFHRIGVAKVEPLKSNPLRWASKQSRVEEPDDWETSGIQDERDFGGVFQNFYFGCEGDDPSPFRARVGGINSVLSSDIGHWDVPAMSNVLPGAFEEWRRSGQSEDVFRRLACDNGIAMFTALRPDFFAGTCLEAYVGAAK